MLRYKAASASNKAPGNARTGGRRTATAPAVLRLQRRDEAELHDELGDFLRSLKRNEAYDVSIQLADGRDRYSDWIPFGNADMSLPANQHVSRKTSVYHAMVYVRRWLHHTGDSAVKAKCLESHIKDFLDPDTHNRVLAGCAFRIRYGVNAAAAVAEFDYLQVESVWSELDPEAFNAPDAYESARSPARRSSRAKAASKKPASKKPTVKKLKAKK